MLNRIAGKTGLSTLGLIVVAPSIPFIFLLWALAIAWCPALIVLLGYFLLRLKSNRGIFGEPA